MEKYVEQKVNQAKKEVKQDCPKVEKFVEPEIEFIELDDEISTQMTGSTD